MPWQRTFPSPMATRFPHRQCYYFIFCFFFSTKLPESAQFTQAPQSTTRLTARLTAPPHRGPETWLQLWGDPVVSVTSSSATNPHLHLTKLVLLAPPSVLSPPGCETGSAVHGLSPWLRSVFPFVPFTLSQIVCAGWRPS